jgi:hypothetical protein
MSAFNKTGTVKPCESPTRAGDYQFLRDLAGGREAAPAENADIWFRVSPAPGKLAQPLDDGFQRLNGAVDFFLRGVTA